jgi:hypothetical protein
LLSVTASGAGATLTSDITVVMPPLNLLQSTETPPAIATGGTPTVNKAGAAATSSLGKASANGHTTDAALRALLLDESTVTGKPRALFES